LKRHGIFRPDPLLGLIYQESATSASGWWQSNNVVRDLAERGWRPPIFLPRFVLDEGALKLVPRCMRTFYMLTIVLILVHGSTRGSPP
jgi:hypothetical protein